MDFGVFFRSPQKECVDVGKAVGLVKKDSLTTEKLEMLLKAVLRGKLGHVSDIDRVEHICKELQHLRQQGVLSIEHVVDRTVSEPMSICIAMNLLPRDDKGGINLMFTRLGEHENQASEYLLMHMRNHVSGWLDSVVEKFNKHTKNGLRQAKSFDVVVDFMIAAMTTPAKVESPLDAFLNDHIAALGILIEDAERVDALSDADVTRAMSCFANADLKLLERFGVATGMGHTLRDSDAMKIWVMAIVMFKTDPRRDGAKSFNLPKMHEIGGFRRMLRSAQGCRSVFEQARLFLVDAKAKQRELKTGVADVSHDDVCVRLPKVPFFSVQAEKVFKLHECVMGILTVDAVLKEAVCAAVERGRFVSAEMPKPAIDVWRGMVRMAAIDFGPESDAFLPYVVQKPASNPNMMGCVMQRVDDVMNHAVGMRRKDEEVDAVTGMPRLAALKTPQITCTQLTLGKAIQNPHVLRERIKRAAFVNVVDGTFDDDGWTPTYPLSATAALSCKLAKRSVILGGMLSCLYEQLADYDRVDGTVVETFHATGCASTRVRSLHRGWAGVPLEKMDNGWGMARILVADVENKVAFTICKNKSDQTSVLDVLQKVHKNLFCADRNVAVVEHVQTVGKDSKMRGLAIADSAIQSVFEELKRAVKAARNKEEAVAWWNLNAHDAAEPVRSTECRKQNQEQQAKYAASQVAARPVAANAAQPASAQPASAQKRKAPQVTAAAASSQQTGTKPVKAQKKSAWAAIKTL